MKFDFTKRRSAAVAPPVSLILPSAPQPAEPGERVIAVIGTAGRDKTKPMTGELWDAMTEDLRSRVSPNDHLVSGGAAWADHLAVHAFHQGWIKRLTLYLPAPLGDKAFIGPRGSAASAANYYHDLFSKVLEYRSYIEIVDVAEAALKNDNIRIEQEPAAPGYGAMFARNKKVAALANAVIAYTFGEGEEPADGGTLNTWKQIDSENKVHVPLRSLLDAYQPSSRPKP